MNTAPRCLLAAVLMVSSWPFRSKKASEPGAPDRALAEQMLQVATNRFARDLGDQDAVLLLQAAETLAPDREEVRQLRRLVAKGKKPGPVRKAPSLEEVVEGCRKRGEQLRDEVLPFRSKAAPLCLLYLRLVEHFEPDDSDLMLALMRLSVQGHNSSLHELLGKRLDLEDILDLPRTLEPTAKSNGPQEEDVALAEQAARLATNRLAKNRTDGTGLLLLRLAHRLNPLDGTLLLTMAQIRRGNLPEPVRSLVNEPDFVVGLVRRAEWIRTKGMAQAPELAPTARLYYLVAEQFRPTDRTVLLGIMKLKREGVEGELDGMLGPAPDLGAVATGNPARPTLGRRWVVPDLGMELAAVNPGEFRMGSAEGGYDERPAHKVVLTKPFWIGTHEVTQSEYKSVMGVNPSRIEGDRNPVEGVSWDDAVAFCRTLTEIEKQAGRLPEGHRYRLPTEAEWEYCCRAGRRTPYSFGSSELKLCRHANYCDSSNKHLAHADPEADDGHAESAPVGSLQPNAWGLHDMHGNVLEWCLDWYAVYPLGTVTDPTGPEAGPARVLRGGSWRSKAAECRSAARAGLPPDNRFNSVGFRVVLGPAIE